MDLAAFVEALPRPSLERVYEAPEACFAVLRGLPPLARAYVLRLLAVGGGGDGGGIGDENNLVPLDVVASWPVAGDATARAKHAAALSKLERLAVVVSQAEGLALTPSFRRHVASAVALGAAGVTSSLLKSSSSLSSSSLPASSIPTYEQRDAFADDAWDGLLLYVGGHEPSAPSRPRSLSSSFASSSVPSSSSSSSAIDFGALLLAEGFVSPRRKRDRRRGSSAGPSTGAGGGGIDVEEVADGDEGSDDDEDGDDVSAVKPTPKGLAFLLSPTVAQLWELLRCVASASAAAAVVGGGGGSGESGGRSDNCEDNLAAVVALLLKLAAGGGKGPPLPAASLAPAALEAALDASALGLLMPFFVSISDGEGGGGSIAAGSRGKKGNSRAGGGGQEEKQLENLWFAPTRLADALRGSGTVNRALSTSSSSSTSKTTTTTTPAAHLLSPLLPVSTTATSATSPDGHVVVETNFRVYAYTTSPSRRAALALFASIERVLPNLVVAALTRSSCLSALDRGITAEQIISHLRDHASPRVSHRVPVVPENVADQVRLWEASRKRLRKVEKATLYSDFSSAREFEAAVQAARAAGALLWVQRGGNGGVGGVGGVGGGSSGAAADENDDSRHGRLAASVEAHEAIKEAIRAARGPLRA